MVGKEFTYKRVRSGERNPNTNLRCNLRAFRAAASLFLLTLLLSCSPDPFIPLCSTGDCNALLTSSFSKDINGYYHAELNWDTEYYPYFPISVQADKTSEEYWYGDNSVVEGRFDTDTYFILSDSVAFTIPLYQPYGGLETYEGFPISVRDTTVVLSQFEGTIVPIIQNDTRVYFSDDNFGRFTTTKLVGPIPPSIKGDTISIYLKVYWDGGEVNQEKSHYIEKFIIE